MLLNGSELKVEMLPHFLLRMKMLLMLFGGFDSENINENGEIVSGGFVTAGFVSLDMKMEEMKK